ncbi:MAG: ABC transporter ATP-binding protein, partial [Planctomycetes bacterium]|nr:ABC transporter ATP-binding protein [Planctomycetota bacterium]
TGATRKDALERVVDATGLQSVWGKFLFACSKGFRQRVGLAQAMLHDPPLLILDEPTNGLDPLQIVEMRDLIRHLGKTKTVLLTSHVMPEVEALADRVILLQHGRVVADGQLSELQEGDGSTFRVRLEGNSANEESLRKAAQSAGIQVASIEPVGDNLEDVFRRLAGKQGGDS